MRVPDYAAEISWLKGLLFVLDHVCVNVTERRIGPMLIAVIEFLDDVFLEVRTAGMGFYDLFSIRVAVRFVFYSQDIHFNASGDERDNGMHVLRNAGRGVKRNRRPYGFQIVLSDATRTQEFASGVGAVDFEAFVRATVLLRQPHIVEHRARKQQLCIKL